MAISIANQRKALATAYGTNAPYGALFTSTGPGTSGSATNEVTGGSPAYARKALSWNTATDNGTLASTVSNATIFDVPGGSTTVTYFGVCVSATAGTADVRDAVAITNQTFASQGTYTITATYQQA